MVPFFLAFSFTMVQHWITTRGFTGGVIVVFCLLVACGLGLPLPEDIPLIIAGAFLCTNAHTWAITGAAAWCGIIGGDCILYFMGRRYGLEITRAPLIGKHVTRQRIQHVEALFEKYGVGVVGIGRMFAGIRGAVVICAGAIRFNFVKFIIVDGLAAIVSGGLFMLLGHWIGEQLNDPAAQRKIHEFKEFFISGGVVLALAFIAFVLWRRRHREELQVVEEKVVAELAAAEKKVAQRLVHTAEKIVRKPHEEAPAGRAPAGRAPAADAADAAADDDNGAAAPEGAEAREARAARLVESSAGRPPDEPRHLSAPAATAEPAGRAPGTRRTLLLGVAVLVLLAVIVGVVRRG
jgi:membrane protein DedA with SNARE-associated domain